MPERRALPKRRNSRVHEARVGSQKIFLTTGEYEDGTLGEIFIDISKEGAALRSVMNCFAIMVSKALQYGMPLREMIDTFRDTRFEPNGPTDNPEISYADSVIDYIFRVLEQEYCNKGLQ